MKQLTLLPLFFLVSACSATGWLKPTSDPDPQVSCPAGRLSWNLRISDQRAARNDSERVIALVRDSLSRSLPGCRWEGGPDSGTITIEIHRFAASLDGAIWDAAAEWSVSALDASGRTLTEFESSSVISRPNYRNLNNEQAALQQAFEAAMQRTLKGLRLLSPSG
jgi:hypothetical protein